jgi:hypothetical protein
VCIAQFWTARRDPRPDYADRMVTVAKLLLAAAAMLAVVAGGLLLASKLGLERLPGDIVIKRGNFTLYAPIGLMIVPSVVGSILLNLFLRH